MNIRALWRVFPKVRTPGSSMEIVGSYRRGAQDSDDIILLLEINTVMFRYSKISCKSCPTIRLYWSFIKRKGKITCYGTTPRKDTKTC